MNIKKRKDGNNIITALFYGDDGTGKSTAVEKYCKENGLNALVFDLDNTNYTSMDIVTEFDLSNDRRTNKCMVEYLDEFKKLDYDTLVIDGIDTLIEALTGSGQGMSAYSSRSKLFYKLIHKIKSLKCNVIYIGQKPMDINSYGVDESPNKLIVRVNALCNEKYHCIRDKNGRFEVETTKYRR